MPDGSAWDASVLRGAVPQLLGWRGWQYGADAVAWEGAGSCSVAPSPPVPWQIHCGGKPYVRVEPAYHEGLDTQVLVTTDSRGEIQKTPVPPGWRLTRSDLIAWTVYHAQRAYPAR
jgi:hypothetical protein